MVAANEANEASLTAATSILNVAVYQKIDLFIGFIINVNCKKEEFRAALS